MISSSSSSESTTSTTEYKSNVMERLGGDSVFEFVVLNMVERIQADATLDKFFGTFEVENLDCLQRTLLAAVFEEHSDDFDLEGFILLRFYCFVEQGFDETHFDVLVHHLLGAMEDAWVDADVVNDAVAIFKSHRGIFKSSGSTTLQLSAPAKQEEKTGRRGSSGEFLLNLLRPKGSKRTRQGAQ